MINTLYISHQLYDWSTSGYNNLFFLRAKNLKKIISSADAIDCRTSLEDLQIKIHEISGFVKDCNKVMLMGFDENFLHCIDQDNIYLYFGFLTALSRHEGKCLNHSALDILPVGILDKKTTRSKTNQPVLWVGGCSFSWGSGIPVDKRYGTLLSDKLQLPLVMQAKPGSSIAWQADQWLRSDVRKGDLAIWGLTNICRHDVFVTETNTWDSMTIQDYLKSPKKYRYWNLNYFDSPTQAVACIKNILQVENYFQKLGIEYYFVNLMDITYLPLTFRNHKRFLDLTLDFDGDNLQKFIDYGSDNQHPGIQQHEKYFLEIHKFIQESRLKDKKTKS